MTSFYDQELERLSETYERARLAEIEQLKIGIVNASEASIIGVGSGGSYTIASLLCTLHETYTGRVSRPSTPLEIISNPTLAACTVLCRSRRQPASGCPGSRDIGSYYSTRRTRRCCVRAVPADSSCRFCSSVDRNKRHRRWEGKREIEAASRREYDLVRGPPYDQ
jgi:hypothetical protein